MPRWAFSLCWRRDGTPMWRDEALVARENEMRAMTAEDARRFAEVVAAGLGIKPERVQAAYEDPAHWLLEEAKLPVNVDVGDPKLFDAAERARMVRTFERGLGAPVAYVLPLCRDGAAWVSEAWELRREKLFLMPGDLPAGSRLPLASLAHLEPADYPIVGVSDAMAPPPLSDPAPPEPARDGVVRTALAVE